MTIDFAVVIGTVLGILFPAFLIDAIRRNDDRAEKSKVKACLVFGAIVFIALLRVRGL